MGGKSTTGHHCPDGGAFPIAREDHATNNHVEEADGFHETNPDVQKGLEIVSEQREDALVQSEFIPSKAHDSPRSPTQDMETRLSVASIDLFHVPNHLFGTLPEQSGGSLRFHDCC